MTDDDGFFRTGEKGETAAALVDLTGAAGLWGLVGGVVLLALAWFVRSKRRR